MYMCCVNLGTNLCVIATTDYTVHTKDPTTWGNAKAVRNDSHAIVIELLLQQPNTAMFSGSPIIYTMLRCWDYTLAGLSFVKPATE